MRTAILTLIIGVIGCRDNTPPPQRVPVPAQNREERAAVHQQDEMKPLAPPPEQVADIHPPFDDAPIVNQRPPEQRAFVDAYRQVGSPRITLFVNRTLEGTIVPSSSRDTRDSANEYLQPGQYDDANAKSLDYQAIENIMTDWLAANGQVTVISPTMARQRLTDQQVRELQEGRPVALSEIAQQLDADILVQVQAHPTKQTRDGLQFRLVSEAMNTKGGQSIGRAVVDIVPPLEKTTINRSTRFLARKLMDDMIQSWSAPLPPARSREAAAPVAPVAPVEPIAPAKPPTTLPSTQP